MFLALKTRVQSEVREKASSREICYNTYAYIACHVRFKILLAFS